jgi:hypothetical protein
MADKRRNGRWLIVLAEWIKERLDISVVDRQQPNAAAISSI